MKKEIYLFKLKEVIKLSLVLTTLFLFTLGYSQAPTDGLKLYYNFESVTGGVVPDVSGNSLNGTAIGAAFTTTGKVGSYGINFPTAAKPAADYIQLPNGITSSLTDFTVASWVYMDVNSDWMRIFDFGGGTNNYMFLTSKGGNLRFAFKNGGGEEFIDGGTGTALPTGKWVHVAVTCSYIANVGTGKLYLNGALVGTNSAITIYPALLDATLGAATSRNYIGKSQYPDENSVYIDPGLNGTIDEFRIYNRATSNTEILQMMGIPTELASQFLALDLGDLSAVKAHLTLSTGTNGVSITWASTVPATIATDGTVTRPAKFDVPVKLTATLKLGADSLVKVFNANVSALNSGSELIAKWIFKDKDLSIVDGEVKVKDISGNDLVGTIKNVARIRTIGESTVYNVLDLGNNNGYFDMDTVIGQGIYALKDYAIGAYFYIDSSYTNLSAAGNFIWSFSNSSNIHTEATGYIIGILNTMTNKISSGKWTDEQAVISGEQTPIGGWHHFAYSQSGTNGSVFLDGVEVGTNTGVTKLPSTVLPIAGRVGTRYNWIGRSCYNGDAYLKKTLVYGFELYKIQLTGDDLLQTIGVADTINALNSAYAENNDVIPPSLLSERDNLSLGDLSAVIADLSLPLNGTIEPTITIKWSSNHPTVLDSAGIVVRPDYLNTTVVITATLTMGTYVVTKEFTATVLATEGTGFASDLLLNYNFASDLVNGETVSDAAEKHFTGTLMNGATVDIIGSTTKFNVLNLGTDTAYFDMGTECGKLLYGLNDYSISVYFLIDSTKTELGANGNFLYNFSNSNDAGVDQNGYMFAKASKVIHCVSTNYHSLGNMQTDNISKMPDSARFHHMVYTQNGTIGTVYYDGKVISSTTFTNLPSVALPKKGFTGTLYNWLGKSCYVGDAYLAKALIADFKLYKKVITEAEVTTMQDETKNLNTALNIVTPSAVPTVGSDNKVVVISSIPGLIQIKNLKGTESISVFDLLGRKIKEGRNMDEFSIKSGFYLVKVDNVVTKVLVK